MKSLAHSLFKMLSKWPFPIACALLLIWWGTQEYPDNVHWYNAIFCGILIVYFWEVFWGILAKLTGPIETDGEINITPMLQYMKLVFLPTLAVAVVCYGILELLNRTVFVDAADLPGWIYFLNHIAFAAFGFFLFFFCLHPSSKTSPKKWELEVESAERNLMRLHGPDNFAKWLKFIFIVLVLGMGAVVGMKIAVTEIIFEDFLDLEPRKRGEWLAATYFYYVGFVLAMVIRLRDAHHNVKQIKPSDDVDEP